jgi:hypothetical protein
MIKVVLRVAAWMAVVSVVAPFLMLIGLSGPWWIGKFLYPALMVLLVAALVRPPAIPVLSSRKWGAALVCALLYPMLLLFGLKSPTAIATMRADAPQAYLTYINRHPGQADWLQELEVLDPAGYSTEMERRHLEAEHAAARAAEELVAQATRDLATADAEAARVAAEIDRLSTDVRDIPYLEFDENLRYYSRLTQLVPDNSNYRERAARYRNLVGLRNQLDRAYEANWYRYELMIASASSMDEDMMIMSDQYELQRMTGQSATATSSYSIRNRYGARPQVTVRYQYRRMHSAWELCRWKAPDEPGSPWVGAC